MGVVKLSTAGILNFQKYSSMRAGIPLPPTGSFDLLETQVLASAAASVTFSSLDTLAAGYQHLQIRYTVRHETSGGGVDWIMRLNGDTGTNYNWHWLQGNGSSVSSLAITSANHMIAGLVPRSGETANAFHAGVIDILDPFVTTKNTTIRALHGRAQTANTIILSSGAWRNTSAVSSITLQGDSGNMVTGTRVSIYGLKTGA